MRKLLFLLVLMTFASPVWGLQELILREEIPVYKKRSSSSRLLKRLEPGDRAILSTRNYGSWRKIQIEYRGRKKFAWIRAKDIRKSRVRFVKDVREKVNTNQLHSRYAFGINSVLSFYWAGAREVESADGLISEVDPSSGMSMYFGFSLDIPYTNTLGFRLYGNLRKDSVNGRQVFSNFSGGSASKTKFTMDREYFSFGVLGKFYKNKFDRTWWGLAGELASGNSVTFVANEENVEVGKDSLPFFVFLIGSWGYDIQYGKNFLVVPEFRLGTALNADAITLNPEFVLNTSYMY